MCGERITGGLSTYYVPIEPERAVTEAGSNWATGMMEA
jgi:hypothetical protein